MSTQDQGLPGYLDRFEKLRQELGDLLGLVHEEIRPSTRVVDIVPRGMRRQVWRRLAEDGYEMPPLVLSWGATVTSTLSVLARSTLLAWLLQSPWFLAALLPMAYLTWLMTRPFALLPPTGCETIYELAVCAARFRREDYEAGLWSEADIAVKVRAVMALQLGLALEEVQPETRLLDLGGC